MEKEEHIWKAPWTLKTFKYILGKGGKKEHLGFSLRPTYSEDWRFSAKFCCHMPKGFVFFLFCILKLSPLTALYLTHLGHFPVHMCNTVGTLSPGFTTLRIVTFSPCIFILLFPHTPYPILLVPLLEFILNPATFHHLHSYQHEWLSFLDYCNLPTPATLNYSASDCLETRISKPANGFHICTVFQDPLSSPEWPPTTFPLVLSALRLSRCSSIWQTSSLLMSHAAFPVVCALTHMAKWFTLSLHFIFCSMSLPQKGVPWTSCLRQAPQYSHS